MNGLTRIESPTMGLRWFGGKLQQAWSVVTLDEKSNPIRHDTEWRDVPTEA